MHLLEMALNIVCLGIFLNYILSNDQQRVQKKFNCTHAYENITSYLKCVTL